MIKEKRYKSFVDRIRKNIRGLAPLSGQIELTYRCNVDCIHCYSKHSEKQEELSTSEWKRILDELHAQGTFWLTITGGEPLIRDDFLEIYTYAKKKGFLVTVFTNGILFDKKLADYLVKYRPYSIEITLNGLTEGVYESISRTKGSFRKVMDNILNASSKKLPLVLKAVGLKENKDEILKLKDFTERLIGKKKFKFDSFITPSLDGDRTPCLHRLSVDEITSLEESDDEMAAQREKEFKKHKPSLRGPDCKYHCNSWFNQFYITPAGNLRFCHITDKYSSDLKKVSFADGFYGRFPDILEERCSPDSKCMHCELKEFCHHCPARAYLEVGDEETSVPYYCELALSAKMRAEAVKKMAASL